MRTVGAVWAEAVVTPISATPTAAVVPAKLAHRLFLLCRRGSGGSLACLHRRAVAPSRPARGGLYACFAPRPGNGSGQCAATSAKHCGSYATAQGSEGPNPRQPRRHPRRQAGGCGGGDTAQRQRPAARPPAPAPPSARAPAPARPGGWRWGRPETAGWHRHPGGEARPRRPCAAQTSSGRRRPRRRSRKGGSARAPACDRADAAPPRAAAPPAHRPPPAEPRRGTGTAARPDRPAAPPPLRRERSPRPARWLPATAGRGSEQPPRIRSSSSKRGTPATCRQRRTARISRPAEGSIALPPQDLTCPPAPPPCAAMSAAANPARRALASPCRPCRRAQIRCGCAGWRYRRRQPPPRSRRRSPPASCCSARTACRRRRPGPLRAAHPGLRLHLIGPLQTEQSRVTRCACSTASKASTARGWPTPWPPPSPRKGARAGLPDPGEHRAGAARRPAARRRRRKHCWRVRAGLGLIVSGLMCIPLAEDPAPHFRPTGRSGAARACPCCRWVLSGDFPRRHRRRCHPCADRQRHLRAAGLMARTQRHGLPRGRGGGAAARTPVPPDGGPRPQHTPASRAAGRTAIVGQAFAFACAARNDAGRRAAASRHL